MFPPKRTIKLKLNLRVHSCGYHGKVDQEMKTVAATEKPVERLYT